MTKFFPDYHLLASHVIILNVLKSKNMNLPKNTILLLVIIFIFIATAFWVTVFLINKNKVTLGADIAEEGGSEFNKTINNMDKIIQNDKMENKSAEILFAGDLMLDRYMRTLIEKKGAEYLTRDIKNLFSERDLNVLNLEGPITGNSSVSLGTETGEAGHFKFTFDKEMARNFLIDNKIGAVNLGNNHILNFGEAGVRETVEFLRENKIDYFGSPLDDKNAYIEKEINGLKIALVCYNRFYNLGSENAINKIKDAKSKNDLAIVYTHWGNEYELVQSEIQQKIAHSFVEAGADLIIGTHPHVVQPLEIYKNKVIFYSLGNFVFDQFFSEDVRDELLVGVSFAQGKTEFVLTPIYRRSDGSLELSVEERRKKLLERLARDSIVADSLRKKIKTGKFEVTK